MTGSAYGFGWGLSPFSVLQQLQHLQQLTSLQQQQLQQIQQLVQQIAYVVSHQLQQLQQHPPAFPSAGIGSPFQTVPYGQQIFPGQPGQVM